MVRKKHNNNKKKYHDRHRQRNNISNLQMEPQKTMKLLQSKAIIKLREEIIDKIEENLSQLCIG